MHFVHAHSTRIETCMTEGLPNQSRRPSTANTFFCHICRVRTSLCASMARGRGRWAHTHTHKQSDTSFSWDGRIPQNKLDNCHVAFSYVVETWAYQLFDCLVPLWSHSCTLAFVIMDGDLLQIYRWTLPGKKPNKSQQHGCSFPTSTVRPHAHMFGSTFRTLESLRV